MVGCKENHLAWYPFHKGCKSSKLKACENPLGGLLRKILKGVCGLDFPNHTLGYGDRGLKSYPWLWKMGQNQTLCNSKCHQINHFWSMISFNSNSFSTKCHYSNHSVSYLIEHWIHWISFSNCSDLIERKIRGISFRNQIQQNIKYIEYQQSDSTEHKMRWISYSNHSYSIKHKIRWILFSNQSDPIEHEIRWISFST